MSYKLSLIKEQTIGQNGWNAFANNPYDEESIAKITDNMGQQDVPVTSIPSPFAQMHLFETSFAFINKNYVNIGKDSSALLGKTTYHNCISNCLDVFELLFSYETLKLSGRVSVAIWEKGELDQLSNSPNVGLKTFAETLRIFMGNYNKDARFTNNGIQGVFDALVLIYLDNTIIAGTSPYTGFFTVGDKLPRTLKSNHENRYFFTDNMPLYQRSEAFQKFINIFFESNPKITQSLKEVYKYIKINRDHVENFELKNFLNGLEKENKPEYLKAYTNLEISKEEVTLLGGAVTFLCEPFDIKEEQDSVSKSDYVIQTSKSLTRPPLALLQGLNKKRWNYYGSNSFSPETVLKETDPIEKRKLPGTTITYPWVSRNDFLAKHLIQLKYPINDTKFWLPNGDVNNIILPLKPEYFKYFTIEDLKNQITLEKLKSGSIVVRLKIPVAADQGNGILKFERTYVSIDKSKLIESEEQGAIVNTSLVFGIYPFFKVSDPRYNDRYKVLSYHDKGEEPSYHFFKENYAEPNTDIVKAKSHARTRKDEGLALVSEYLELSSMEIDDNNIGPKNDITFDAVHVAINNTDKGLLLNGTIIPLMGEPIQLANGEPAIAFDIGTSNSHVAFRTGNQVEHLTTYSGKINSAKPDLVMLHRPVEEDNVSRFDLDSVLPMYGTTQFAEFMPSIVGGKTVFTFPIRSIINIDNDTNAEIPDAVNVLSNANIPFAFGKRILRKSYDFTHSNIKWGVTDTSNLAARHKLKAFIEQLVWLGRNKLLSEGYNPAAADVIWFKPLSMGHDQTIVFEKIWEELYKKYFKKSSTSDKLEKVTESWAPFFSYRREFGAGEVYVNIDIGGGTTDLIVFENNKPALTTSFRFAGNSLFESHGGNDPFDNGFITKYEAIMRAVFENKIKETDILDYIKDSKGLQSTDLISYFFSHDSFTDKLMLDSEFKLLFLLHNCAIFYYSFQILKMSKIDKLPSYVGISGNGAKLLTITNGLKDLNKPRGISSLATLILKKVITSDTSHKLELQILDNPKESTAIGGIKGLESIKKNISMDEDNYHISIGNTEDLFLKQDGQNKKKYQYVNFLKPGDDTIKEVSDNVLGFFDYFFDELWYDADFHENFGLEKSFNPEKLKEYFSNESRILSSIRETVNHKIEVERDSTLNDSLFFEAIKSYLYAFSRIIVSDKINEFKGA